MSSQAKLWMLRVISAAITSTVAIASNGMCLDYWQHGHACLRVLEYDNSSGELFFVSLLEQHTVRRDVGVGVKWRNPNMVTKLK